MSRPQRHMKFACPLCHAAPSVGCDMRLPLEPWQQGEEFGLDHRSRVELVKPIIPCLLTRPVYRIRGEGSGSCRRKNHANCSGSFNLGHGLGHKACGCTCHTKPGQNKSLTNWQTSANIATDSNTVAVT